MDRAKSDKLEWVEWIIAQRKKRGWSQQLLGEKVGTTRQTINDYEQYRRVSRPDPEILSKISAIFGENDDYLIRLGGYMPQSASDDEDPWVKKMSAKLRRVPAWNQDAAERMIESLAEGDIEPRQMKPRSKPSKS